MSSSQTTLPKDVMKPDPSKAMSFFMFVMLSLLFMRPESFAEAKSPNQWTFVGKEDGVELYKGPSNQRSIPFLAKSKLAAPINDVSTVLMDFKNKQRWAPKLKHVTLHEQPSSTTFIFSEYYTTPWPATDREFLLKGEIIGLNTKRVIFKAASITKKKEFQQFADKRHLLAHIDQLNLTLIELDPETTEIQFEFHGHLGGWIPDWLNNLIQKKWPLKFILELEKWTLSQESSSP